VFDKGERRSPLNSSARLDAGSPGPGRVGVSAATTATPSSARYAVTDGPVWSFENTPSMPPSNDQNATAAGRLEFSTVFGSPEIVSAFSVPTNVSSGADSKGRWSK